MQDGRRGRKSAEVLSVLLLLLACGVITRSLLQGTPVVSYYQEIEIVQEVTAKWTSDGIEIVVRTVRLDGESDSDFAARHKAAVTAQLVQFPKDA